MKLCGISTGLNRIKLATHLPLASIMHPFYNVYVSMHYKYEGSGMMF